MWNTLPALDRPLEVSTGDGWTTCALGHRHWGVYGAAGLLLVHRDSQGYEWMLMQHRSWWNHHGDTWGLLGGACELGETVEQTASREAWEEATLPSSVYRVMGCFVDDHGGWSYTTVLAHAEERVPVAAAASLPSESADVAWVRRDDLDRLPLHPGFAASWAAVARLLD